MASHAVAGGNTCGGSGLDGNGWVNQGVAEGTLVSTKDGEGWGWDDVTGITGGMNM